MQPTSGVEVDAFREKVQAFLAEHLPAGWKGIGALDLDAADAFTLEWREVLGQHGYLAVNLPVEYGGPGLTVVERVVLAEELARAGVPSGTANDGFGITMLGNTLLRWGTERQKADELPAILTRAKVWCQGYAEPNAGSDLPTSAAEPSSTATSG